MEELEEKIIKKLIIYDEFFYLGEARFRHKAGMTETNVE